MKNCAGSNAPKAVCVYGQWTGCPVCKANAGVSSGGNVKPHLPNHVTTRR